jgi:hypothetical protein
MAMTRSQFAILKLAQKRLGLDDDTYRAVLRIHGGVESAKDLKPTGFKTVMQYFADCGFESDWRKRTYGDRRPGMASPKQIDTIRSRWFDFSGRNDEAALNRWLERSYRVTALRFLDQEQASKALTGLKKMVARRSVFGGRG